MPLPKNKKASSRRQNLKKKITRRRLSKPRLPSSPSSSTPTSRSNSPVDDSLPDETQNFTENFTSGLPRQINSDSVPIYDEQDGVTPSAAGIPIQREILPSSVIMNMANANITPIALPNYYPPNTTISPPLVSSTTGDTPIFGMVGSTPSTLPVTSTTPNTTISGIGGGLPAGWSYHQPHLVPQAPPNVLQSMGVTPQQLQQQQQVTINTNSVNIRPLTKNFTAVDMQRLLNNLKMISSGGTVYFDYLRYLDASARLPVGDHLRYVKRKAPTKCPCDPATWESWDFDTFDTAISVWVKEQTEGKKLTASPEITCERAIHTILFGKDYTPNRLDVADDFYNQLVILRERITDMWPTDAAQQQKHLLAMLHQICTKPDDTRIQHPTRVLASDLLAKVSTMKTISDFIDEFRIATETQYNAYKQLTEGFCVNAAITSIIPYLPAYAAPKRINEDGTVDTASNITSPSTSTTPGNRSKKENGGNGKNSNKADKRSSKNVSSSPQGQTSSTTNSKGSTSPPALLSGADIPKPSGIDIPDKPMLWDCNICGGQHQRDDCLLKRHPDCNTHGTPWPASQKGQLWLAKDRKRLPPFATLNGGRIEVPEYVAFMKARGTSQTANEKLATTGNQIVDYVNAIHSTLTNNVLVPISIINSSGEETETRTLIDTGAIGANYISTTLADRLEKELGIQRQTLSNTSCNKVCSALLDSSCTCRNSYMCLDVNFKNIIHPQFPDILINKRINKLRMMIVPLKVDLIIGLPTIRRHKLTRVLDAYFSDTSFEARTDSETEDDDVNNANLNEPISDSIPAELIAPILDDFQVSAVRFVTGSSSSEVPDNSQPEDALEQLLKSRVAKIAEMLAAFQLDTKSLDELLEIETADMDTADPFEGTSDISEMIPPSDTPSTFPLDPLPAVEGDSVLHQRLRALCATYKQIFSREVKPTPAHVEALELHLKENSTWYQRQGESPRPQPQEKSREIHRQLHELIRLKVIRRSKATAYSQIHLVPKPDLKGLKKRWRMTMDYRKLNEALKSSESWVIPNIKQLLRRIGQSKPKYFAVLDLTSGFFQAPLAAMYRELTAFITEFGVFEWNRCPMGVHVAPTYFQRVIAGTILSELMFNGIEMYIDDIIVYGNTEEELLQNLEKLFARCAKFNITLHPDKCRLGLTSLEYVGHVLDKDGVRMSEDKIRKVLEFPLPTKVKQLQAFLGLANYFRDHIKDLATKMAPLYDMTAKATDGHKQGSRILPVWTPQTKLAFEEVRTAIEACPRLYFFEDENPENPSNAKLFETFLETDASDYGIGAYLYQRKLGETTQRPIAFLSKSLSRVQRRWSTIEKEQYAIFYALKKWEHMLRGIHFTLRTDHDNLRLMNDGSPKVVRWKLALQEFDCKVEHLAGKLNIVADPLSRLVSEDTPPSSITTTDLDAGIVASLGFETIRIPEDKLKLISEHHNATVGHLGVHKTLKRMATKGVSPWVHMRQHVKKFIRECPVCQKSSQTNAIHNVKPYVVSSMRAWERISMDTIGPIKVKGCEHQHILVIIDNFSRFVNLYPCISTDAEEAAKHLLHHIGTFGLPDQIMSDEGSQFVNDTLKYLSKRLGVQSVNGIAYSKQENAIVERANKEVMRHLRAFIYDTNVLAVWVDCLPMVQRIINSTAHESTGLSPAQIIFGNTVDLDNRLFEEHIGQDVSDGITTRKKNVALRAWIDSLWTAQKAMIERAEQTLQVTNTLNLQERAPKGPITHLEVGSLVLCRYPTTAMGQRPPSKLHLLWEGPFKLLKADGPDRLTIRDLTTGKDKVVHISRLKPFHHDPAIHDPRDVARRDDQETFVEQVLSHEGDMERKKSLKFHVKYAGFPVTTGTESYLPWSELRLVEALHIYLEEQGLEKYIPKNLEQWESEEENDDDQNHDHPNHVVVLGLQEATVAVPPTTTAVVEGSSKRVIKRKAATFLPNAREQPPQRRQRGKNNNKKPR